MREKPQPSPQPEKPFEELGIAELDSALERLEAEEKEILITRGVATDPDALRALGISWGQKTNEIARYKMRKQELILKGHK